jgi:hypothetical protein
MSPESKPDEYRELLDAICFVETGGHPNPSEAIGDAGRSLGPYQISEDYWIDGMEFGRIGGRYEDVKDKEYAERIICAYWDRYCYGGSWETRARCHNGGPLGSLKNSTKKFWKLVSAELRRQTGDTSGNR